MLALAPQPSVKVAHVRWPAHASQRDNSTPVLAVAANARGSVGCGNVLGPGAGCAGKGLRVVLNDVKMSALPPGVRAAPAGEGFVKNGDASSTKRTSWEQMVHLLLGSKRR